METWSAEVSRLLRPWNRGKQRMRRPPKSVEVLNKSNKEFSAIRRFLAIAQSDRQMKHFSI
ncbi:hypothetical protein PRIPAC_83931, partial [Pristionchus pacificus]|uniref:Uncharacterized protein n=1 Tax=Pristionchus pacificus TaxID=54126 RepID=A0A2A6BM18_PRIPA